MIANSLCVYFMIVVVYSQHRWDEQPRVVACRMLQRPHLDGILFQAGLGQPRDRSWEDTSIDT